MKKIFTLFFLISVISSSLSAQKTAPMSVRMAATILNEHPDSLVYSKESKKSANWNYENGVILNAFENLWLQSGDGKYYKYIQKIMDSFIGEDGSIRTTPLMNII